MNLLFFGLQSFFRAEGFYQPQVFQETIKILSQAAFFYKRDFLRGLKKMLS
jgi:hypothetical protein